MDTHCQHCSDTGLKNDRPCFHCCKREWMRLYMREYRAKAKRERPQKRFEYRTEMVRVLRDPSERREIILDMLGQNFLGENLCRY